VVGFIGVKGLGAGPGPGGAGVTEFETGDAALVPTTLVAVTVNVYAVPFVSPVTSHVVGNGLTDVTAHVKPPGLDVTV
jgi:hypothetical protein